MQRDLSRLTGRVHDLLVVGGGVQGACLAWDATLRGLAVAVVERDDFGGATSANSLRIAHGGLRYLARGDFPRMRESIRERSRLMAIAPGLVMPLPVMVPTRGAGTESRAAMRVALALNDLASIDRNRGLDPAHRIPAGRLLSRQEAVRLFAPLGPRGLTGAALWHDARIRSPERLTLSFVRSAAERGAAAANYVQAERVLTASGAVAGVEAADRRTGATLEIRARAVAIAAGRWTTRLAASATGRPVPGRGGRQAVGLNLVVGRALAPVAVGIRALSGAADDPVIGGYRYLFLAPQDGSTLLGTWYAVDDGTDPRAVAERGAERLRAEFNAACPGLELTPGDADRVQLGWLPLKAGLEPGRDDALAERPRVLDHAADGVRHLFSVEAVKYTTARAVAEAAMNRIVRSLGLPDQGCRTADTPLAGAHAVPADDPRLATRVAEAVRDEMALTLADIVYRRTAIGEPPGPAPAAVEEAARGAGAELGWDPATRQAEIEDVMRQARGPGARSCQVSA
ncbi:MAG TPA: FAD-dependent oxidoreductase [Gemmatimonadales bacterium]|nr:FAD-dependent oxidoreductase [Gemmatimonadales bacterium]